jgi:hypothetical protein
MDEPAHGAVVVHITKTPVKAFQSQFRCHPAARSALQAVRKMSFQVDLASLDASLVAQLQMEHPIHFVKTETCSAFFTGFRFMNLIEAGLIQEVCVQKMPNMREETIELKAWLDVFRVLLFSADTKTGMATFKKALNEYCPTHIRDHFTSRKKMSRTELNQFTGLSIKEIRTQERRLASTNAPVPPSQSLLNQILKANRNA